MPQPAGAINTVTGQVWDETLQDWVDATSTPDLSTFAMPATFRVALEGAAPGVTPAIDASQKPGESWELLH